MLSPRGTASSTRAPCRGKSGVSGSSGTPISAHIDQLDLDLIDPATGEVNNVAMAAAKTMVVAYLFTIGYFTPEQGE